MSYLIDEIERAYWECALWSSTFIELVGDEGEMNVPMDRDYDVDNVHSDTKAEHLTDIRSFVNDEDLEDDLDLWVDQFGPAQIGHDFWLTRNGHGAGFWDRGLGEAGERLSKAARVYGGSDLYIDDEGKIRS